MLPFQDGNEAAGSEPKLHKERVRKQHWQPSRTAWCGVESEPHVTPPLEIEGADSTTISVYDFVSSTFLWILWPLNLYLSTLLRWWGLLYCACTTFMSSLIPLAFDPQPPPPDPMLRPKYAPVGAHMSTSRQWLFRSATQLAQSLRDRQITSTELVQVSFWCCWLLRAKDSCP